MGNDEQVPATVESQDLLPTAPPGYEPGTEQLPPYMEEESLISGLQRIQQARRSSATLDVCDLDTWREYLASHPLSTKPWDERDGEEKFIAMSGLFMAIDSEKEDVIAFLIENEIVTPNVQFIRETPLLRALTSRNVRVVRQLLDLGADKDALGSVSRYFDHSERTHIHTLRTPLQHAASLGSLVLVKLLLETYHCDDSIVAPDGQTALRLAAANGHREIVDYLPSRRAGGFRRWKHAHKKSLRRAKKAAKKIGEFVEFFVWDVPKLFLWDIPKDNIAKPVAKWCVWCWEHRREFGPWCKGILLKAPGGIVSLGKGIGRGLAKIPTALRDVGQALWKFVTETLPRWTTKMTVWLWKFVSERVPKALGVLARWIANLATTSAKAMWNVVLKTLSLLSTAVEAVVSFFRRVTLADIWNGFLEVLKAIFVTFPTTLLSWVQGFGKTSYKVMKTLFGTIGKIIWWIGCGVGWVIVYVPRQLWKILTSFGESFVKALHEVRVQFNPKAM